MKVIQISPCTCYTSLLIVASILEILSKFSPFDGQSQSFGWYEIVFLSYSFLTLERKKKSAEPELVKGGLWGGELISVTPFAKEIFEQLMWITRVQLSSKKNQFFLS
jgi:hypothetical protein